MLIAYIISVFALHISTVATQYSLQNDLQFLKDELEQLKDIADGLKNNITSLEETNKELTKQLHYTNQTFTSMNTAMQNDLVFLQQKTNDVLKENISSVEETNKELTKQLHYTNQKFTSMNTAIRNDLVFLHQTNQNLSKSVGSLQQKTNVHRMFTVQNSKLLEHVQHNQVIKFDEITTNEGGGYDSKTGVFTVDITGWYVFFSDIRVGSSNHMCWSDLVKNNVRKVLTLSMSGGKQHEHSAESNVAILLLQLGDKVWIRSGPYDGSDCRVDDHSSFSGFLLSAV